ncbi:hypothetical protein L6260_04125 [Candidatus Parcubacteria bacterium]|nr:hypothetical protein [Candidatus Parcubacteria bacterium]
MISKKQIAHVVAVNMGYGHERPAHTLIHLAYKDKIVIANDYANIPESDKHLWESGRKLYEQVSRFKKVPILGKIAFGIMDQLQRIPDFYPRRDLSAPSLQLWQFYNLIHHKDWMRHLIDDLAKHPLPLVCTFMTPAFAAEEFGYPGDIYVLCTDTDISRAWAPLHPKKSRIKYFAPTGRVAERLKLYGVPEENIELTGFPLPISAIGGVEPKNVHQDLARRICHLDPRKIFTTRAKKTLEAHMGASFEAGIHKKNGKPIHLAFFVGGAGAQGDIGAEIIKSLSCEIKRARIKLTLVAGTRPEVANYFEEEIKKSGLAKERKSKLIDIIFEQNRPAYFETLEKALRGFDVIWTKPSEMSFYTGLGLPIIMTPPVGSQEDFNRQWLMQIAAGIDQLDPKYTNEWLFDWIASGALARMAWNGFIEAPTHGAYRIEDIILGRPNTIHELPLVV